MLLAIDIGNTNIVLGVFAGNKLKETWRISTDEKKTEDEYASIIKNFLLELSISRAIISSVVPNLNITFKRLINKYFHLTPLIVTNKLKMNLRLKYPNPSEIGADRIVNAVAAISLYKPPLIIIDFGTAITFCYVDKNKSYRGGLILPGVPIMLNALHSGTAKLPEVEINKTDYLIGKNTAESIQSGVYHQTIGALNYIIKQLFKKYDKNAKIILTGGLARLFQEDITPKSKIDLDLTLYGLNILYNLNKKK